MKTKPLAAAAAAMGRSKSPAKKQAARENGKKGGRPKKETARIFKNRDGFWTVMLESGELADGLLEGDAWLRLDYAIATVRRRTNFRPVRDFSLDRSI